MPNFHTINFKYPQLPFECGGYLFAWEVEYENSKLVFVKKGDIAFFINVYKRNNNTYLIKGEKISRPTQVIYLQEALDIYAKFSMSTPIFSNISPASNRLKQKSNVLKNIDFFANDFFTCKNSNFCKEILFEIGFGSGRHLLYLAKQNPDKIIIGVEIHKPSIEQVIKQCKALKIENIILIDYDARELLEFFPSNVIESIFIHFPVPWDKKPHRRVISKAFVSEAIRTLKVNGTLELRTDSDLYFQYSIEVFNKTKDVKLDTFINHQLEISSKYEDRWKKQDKNIYDAILTNKKMSTNKEPLNKLDFDNKPNLDRIRTNFTPKTYIGDDFFIHFETLHVGSNKLVIKLAFGDKQRGEHSFIIVEEDGIFYFPKSIYSTNANKKAHHIIKQWLNE